MEKLGEVGLARVATWLQGEEGARSAGAPFKKLSTKPPASACSAPLPAAVPGVFPF